MSQALSASAPPPEAIAPAGPRERQDLPELVGDIERLEGLMAGWDEAQRLAAHAYGRAIEALQGEAIRRLVRSLKDEPAALRALKGAAADEVVYAVLRRHGILKPSLSERVETALEGVRPMLASHGGDVELVGVEPPRVTVRFTGSCDGCPSSQLTFHAGVKQAVEAACPEITEVIQVASGRAAAPSSEALVSPFSLARGGRWVGVVSLSAIPEGGACSVEVDGRRLLVGRVAGLVVAWDNACAHLGLPLDAGDVKGGVITCPHHGFQYDLGSGECITAPSVSLVAVPARVAGGEVQVKVAG